MTALNTTLGILTDPGLLYTLIPVGIVMVGLITFEIAMAVTIASLPRSRFQQKWTPQEQRRVMRTFAVIFCLWPTAALVIVAHVYLSLLYALLADLLVLGLVGLGMWWLIHGVRQQRLVMAGHCEQCFYDLRASKNKEHCPECGTQLHDHPMRIGNEAVTQSDITS